MMSGFRAFIQTPRFQKYLQNTGWIFFEKLFALITTFAVGIYLARYLGPSRFGLLSFSISYVALFSPLAALGIDSILVRELTKRPTDESLLMGSALVLKGLGTAAMIGLVSISLRLQNLDGLTTGLILVISFSYLGEIFNIFDSYNRARVQANVSTWASLITRTIASILRVALILNTAPLMAFAIVILGEKLLLAVCYGFFYRLRLTVAQTWAASTSSMRTLLRDAWPLALSGFAIMIYMKIDQVMLKLLLHDLSLVGYYGVATTLTEVWYFLPMVICMSLAPAITRSRIESPEKYLRRLQQLYSLLFLISLTLMTLLIMFSGPLVRGLYGQTYTASAGILKIYILSFIMTSLGVGTSQFLINENLTRISFVRTALGMGANIVLNLVLIPRYHALGAAWATVISYTVPLISLGFFHETRSHLRLVLNALRPDIIIKILRRWGHP